MIKATLALAIAAFLSFSAPAIAELVKVDTDADVIAETSFSVGSYIFETSTGIINLIDGSEDFIVWNSFSVPVTMSDLTENPSASCPCAKPGTA